MTKSRNKKLSPRKNKSRRRQRPDSSQATRARQPFAVQSQGTSSAKPDSESSSAAKGLAPLEGLHRVSALWRPAWQALDQALQVGSHGSFWLCPLTAESTYGPTDVTREFCRGLPGSAAAICFQGTILAIEHPQLGSFVAVDTHGLDYRFLLADGRELVVNAEESPGLCVTPGITVQDWTLLVQLQSP